MKKHTQIFKRIGTILLAMLLTLTSLPISKPGGGDVAYAAPIGLVDITYVYAATVGDASPHTITVIHDVNADDTGNQVSGGKTDIDYKKVFDAYNNIPANSGSITWPNAGLIQSSDDVSAWYAEAMVPSLTGNKTVTVYAIPTGTAAFQVILNYNGGKYPANTGAGGKTIIYPGSLNASYEPAPGEFNPEWLSYIYDGHSGIYTDTPVLAGYSFAGWYTGQSTLGGAPVGTKWDLDKDEDKDEDKDKYVAYAGLTLYAHWEEAVTVVYHYGAKPSYDSGTRAVTWDWALPNEKQKPVPAAYAGPLAALAASSFSDDPSRAGFVGWRLSAAAADKTMYTEIDRSIPAINNAITGSSDGHTLDVYARYQSVTYLKDNGSLLYKGPFAKRLDEVPDYYAYTEGDYNGNMFSDWYTQPSGGNKINYKDPLFDQDPSYKLTDSALICAQYRDQRQVTFLDGFGRTFRTLLVGNNSTLTFETVNDQDAFESFSAPSGEYFTAWYIEKGGTGGSDFVFSSASPSYTVTKDIIVRPKLSKKLVYINYTNASDGHSVMFDAVDLTSDKYALGHQKGDSYTIDLEPAERDGYTFNGWSSTAHDSGSTPVISYPNTSSTLPGTGHPGGTFSVPDNVKSGDTYYLYANGSANWKAAHAQYTIAYWVEKPRLAIDDIDPTGNDLIHQKQSGWMTSDDLKYYDKVGEREVTATNSQIDAGSTITATNPPADGAVGTITATPANPVIYGAAGTDFTSINTNNFGGALPVSATAAANIDATRAHNSGAYIQYYKTLGTTIAGDGTSVINVLYRRKVKVVNIYSNYTTGLGSNGTANVANILHNGVTYARNETTGFLSGSVPYKFNVKFEDDVIALWPQMDELNTRGTYNTICDRADGNNTPGSSWLRYAPVTIDAKLMNQIIANPDFNMYFSNTGGTANPRYRVSYVEATAAEWAAATAIPTPNPNNVSTMQQSPGNYTKYVTTAIPGNPIRNYVLHDEYTVYGYASSAASGLLTLPPPIDGTAQIGDKYATTETLFNFYSRVEASIIYRPGIIGTAAMPPTVTQRTVRGTPMNLRTKDEVIADWLAPPTPSTIEYRKVNYEFAGWSWVDQTKALRESDKVGGKYNIDNKVAVGDILSSGKNPIYAWWAELPFTITVIDNTEKVPIKHVVKRYLNEDLDYPLHDLNDVVQPALVNGLTMDNIYDGSTDKTYNSGTTYEKRSLSDASKVDRTFNYWETNFAGNFYKYEPTLNVTRNITITANYGIAPDYVQIWYLGDSDPAYKFPILMPSANLSAGIAGGLSTVLDAPAKLTSGGPKDEDKLFAGWQVIKYDNGKWVEVKDIPYKDKDGKDQVSSGFYNPRSGDTMPIVIDKMATNTNGLPDSPVINLPLNGNKPLTNGGDPDPDKLIPCIPKGNYIFLKPIFANEIFWDNNHGSPPENTYLVSGMTLNIPGHMPDDGKGGTKQTDPTIEVINEKKYGMVGWYSVSEAVWNDYQTKIKISGMPTAPVLLPYTYKDAKTGDFPSPTGDVIFTDSKAIKDLKKMDQTIYLIARWVPVVTFDINDGSDGKSYPTKKDVITNLDGTVTLPTVPGWTAFKGINGQTRFLAGWDYWRPVDDTANASKNRPWDIDTTKLIAQPETVVDPSWKPDDPVSVLTTGRLADIYPRPNQTGTPLDTEKWNGVLMARWTADTTVDIYRVPTGLEYDPESAKLGKADYFIKAPIEVKFTGLPTDGVRYLEISFICDNPAVPADRSKKLTISVESNGTSYDVTVKPSDPALDPNLDPPYPSDWNWVSVSDNLYMSQGGIVYTYTFNIPTALVWRDLSLPAKGIVVPVDVYAKALSVGGTASGKKLADDDDPGFEIRPINNIIEREKPAFPLR